MKLLARLLKGTPVTPRRTPTPEWHPLAELDDDRSEQVGIRKAAGPLSPAAAAAFAELERAELKAAGQCTAPTKTGRPCSKPPRPGTDRCTLPAHQRT